ncbi:MAG: hypothetical protein WBF33_10310 [Candidatus Nitrosopolaris sp.]
MIIICISLYKETKPHIIEISQERKVKMFENKDYIKQLERIRGEKLLPLVEFAKEIGITYLTLKRAMDPENKVSMTWIVMRKIKNYIELNTKPVKE